MCILYLFIALGATTIGALTGMGGGVIIKPLCDMLGHYDAATIGVLSCVTVFAMSAVSLSRQLLQGARLDFSTAIPLGFGSVAGGILGQHLLDLIIEASASNGQVVVIQNICLGLLILVVFLYMLFKSRLPTLHLRGIAAGLLTGILLGIFSSFLGIGGGPINVALLIFLFSYDTKTATMCSILTIFFAQISKLGTLFIFGSLGSYDLRVLPWMAAGAILGGFLGATLNRRLPERIVEYAFNGVQLLVLAICVMNIVQSI